MKQRGRSQQAGSNGADCKNECSPFGFTAGDPRIQRALRLLQEKMDCSLHVKDLAQSVLLSKSRFAYLFRRETAASPARLLKCLRLLEARRILSTTNLSVKEVASCVGLNDLSHFVRDFESTFGLSPARYRRRQSSSQERLQSSAHKTESFGRQGWQSSGMKLSRETGCA